MQRGQGPTRPHQEGRAERDELAFSRALLHAQSEATLDGIVVVSPEGRMISWNARFVEMWGIPAEVLDRGDDEEAIASVLPRVSDPTAFLERLEHLYKHPEEHGQDEIELVDGRVFDRWSAPLTAEDGWPLGRAWFFRDVTPQKVVEARLRANEERAAFLAEASAVVGRSLDHRGALVGLARLAVPTIADWAMVHLLDDAGRPVLVASEHADDEQRSKAASLRTTAGVNLAAQRGAGKVLRTGSVDWEPEIRDSWLEAAVDGDERALEALRAIGLRSYICVPLAARGRVLGSLTLLTAASGRRYERSQVTLAEDLADRVALAVDNARLYREKSKVARALQEGLLPPMLPVIDGVELASRYRYSGDGSEIGGDFYDVVPTRAGEWGLVIGDVCGKGAPAAALTALARYTIRAIAMTTWRPSKVLVALNRAMLRQARDERFASVAYARLKPTDVGASVTVSIGGHPLPLILRADGTVERIGATGLVLGIFDKPRLRDRSAELYPGDALVLYTDGVTEARTPTGLLGEDGLIELLRANAGVSAPELARRIEHAVVEIQDGDLGDDLALLIARIPD